MDEILEPLEKDVSVYFNKYEELNLGFWKWRLHHKNLIEITINVKNSLQSLK